MGLLNRKRHDTLQRTRTNSSRNDLLKQIRNAVNPNQKMQNRVLMVQAAMVTAAVILLIVFALMANSELMTLKSSASKELVPNLDAIVNNLQDIKGQVATSYEKTEALPLLAEMSDVTKSIEGNLSITVNAMTNSPVFTGGIG
mmetsp:Transcript_2999/g.7305  ORF Transcript_2999/g.7305 Transcript_2999/m.7305 type:complete len:143 (+) Transcript_2999:299-727(+)